MNYLLLITNSFRLFKSIKRNCRPLLQNESKWNFSLRLSYYVYFRYHKIAPVPILTLFILSSDTENRRAIKTNAQSGSQRSESKMRSRQRGAICT